MKKVLIITDHKWRDLAGYVYLKILLENNYDIKVRLCRLGEDRFWVLHEKPDVVIYNHLFEDRKVKFASWLKKHNVGVIILPTENIPLKHGIEDLFAGKYTDLSPVDLYLSWNRIIAERIVALGKLPLDKVKVIGIPRFDFYTPPLTQLLPGKVEVQKKYGLALNPDAKIVLFATNFTVAGFSNNKSFIYKDWKTLRLDRVEGYKPEQIEDRIRWDALSRDLTVQSVRQLLKDFPDLQIIYKPHPTENHLFYKDVISAFNEQFQGRFAFVVQEYIWNLLGVADVVIQRTCTTAIEAWVFGKPTLELHLHPDEFYFLEEHARGSNTVYKYEDMKKYVDYYINGGTIPEAVKSYRNFILNEWCHTIDGKRTREAAKNIAELLQAKERTRYSITARDFIAHYPKEYSKQIYRYIRNFIRKKFIGVDKLGRIDKQFMKKDVKFWEERIASMPE